MTKIGRHGFRGVIILSILGFAGCFQKELPKRDTYPTRGRIMWKKKPVRFISVRLEPLDPLKGMPADGQTGADGTFSIRTYSNAEPDGAVPGQYRLILGEGSDEGNTVTIPKGEKPTNVPKIVLDEERIVEIEETDNDLPIDL
jgi:hypothetical protein